MNRKKWFDYNETPPQIFSLQISETWLFLGDDFQSFLNIFKVDIKSQILPEFIKYHLDVFIKLSGLVFIYFYVLEESKVVAQKSSIKKVFLNIPQCSQENIWTGVSFAIKLQAEGLQLH